MNRIVDDMAALLLRHALNLAMDAVKEHRLNGDESLVALRESLSKAASKAQVLCQMAGRKDRPAELEKVVAPRKGVQP